MAKKSVAIDTSRPRNPYIPMRVPVDLSAGDRAIQSAKDECDINTIMRRYERDGLVAHVNKYQGDYGDFTEVPTDYHEAISQVLAAQEMFMTIPADVRAEFANDPGQFLKFVEGASIEELRERGLADPVPAHPSHGEPAAEPAEPSPAEPAEPKA